MVPNSRRHFIAAASCATLLPSALHGHAAPLVPTTGKVTMLPLWPDLPPGGGGPRGPVLGALRSGALSHITTPTLTVYQPTKANGTAVLLAAGGGYRRIMMDKEALPAAAWLNSLGVTVFVLTYRLPAEGWAAGRLAPFQDAQRAIRLIHYTAGHYGINPGQLGLLGFSAGGHLMGLCATRPDWQTYTPLDAADTLPLAVRYAMLAYPVISLCPPYDQTQTRRSMVGAHPTEAEALAWSVQSYITDHTPPLFMVHAVDDPIAKAQQTEMLQHICAQHHVSATRYLLPQGGHGFGLRQPYQGTPWSSLAACWLRENQFIPA